jgi:chromate reductase
VSAKAWEVHPDRVPIFVYWNMFPLNQPEVLIANASQKFDEKGILKDAETLERTNELLAALVDWRNKLE